MSESKELAKNFIQRIIDEDNKSGKWDNRVHTRFPLSPMDICILVMPNPFA